MTPRMTLRAGHTLSKAEALRIQAEQVAYYAARYPHIDVAGIVAKATTADALTDGEHDLVDINRHIPRGGWIEQLIGQFQQPSD